MSVKSFLIPRIAAKMLSKKKHDKKRIRFERTRIKTSEEHIVEFFHDPSDPYSQLLEKVLPALTK